MIRRVEGNIFRVVLIGVTHVVSNNINHNPDISLVACINKRFKTISTTKMAVYFSHVLGSITMELVGVVIRNRRDPNSIETHTLNVVKIVLNTLEVTTTIVGLFI